MVEKDKAANDPPSFPRYPGWCSFCRKNYKDVGPLAEGPDQVYICFQCCLLCASIIHGVSKGGEIKGTKPQP
jgi:hypothetical protein